MHLKFVPQSCQEYNLPKNENMSQIKWAISFVIAFWSRIVVED